MWWLREAFFGSGWDVEAERSLDWLRMGYGAERSLDLLRMGYGG